jgi:hypothetical protein
MAIQEQTCRTINITFSHINARNAMQCNTMYVNAMQCNAEAAHEKRTKTQLSCHGMHKGTG